MFGGHEPAGDCAPIMPARAAAAQGLAQRRARAGLAMFRGHEPPADRASIVSAASALGHFPSCSSTGSARKPGDSNNKPWGRQKLSSAGRRRPQISAFSGDRRRAPRSQATLNLGLPSVSPKNAASPNGGYSHAEAQKRSERFRPITTVRQERSGCPNMAESRPAALRCSPLEADASGGEWPATNAQFCCTWTYIYSAT